MENRGILFDKDGTCIRFWINVNKVDTKRADT